MILAVVLPLTLVLAGLGTFGALAVDRHARRTLPSGAFIQGVDVGGLRFEQAVTRVRERVEAPLHRPLTLTVDEFKVETSPWELGYRVDVPKAVREAMGVDAGDWVIFRVEGNGRALVARTEHLLDLAGSVPVPAGKRGTPWDEVRRSIRDVRARR